MNSENRSDGEHCPWEDDRPDILRGKYICELLYARFEKFQELQEFQKEVSFFKPGESAGTGVHELSLQG